MKRIDCVCGKVVEGKDDEELWEKAQEHLAVDHPDLVGNLRSDGSRSLLHVHNQSPISDNAFVVLKKMKHHRAESKSRCQRQQQFN